MDGERMGDTDSVKKVIENYAKACNTGDFDLWMSLWADDGVQMPPNTPMRVGKKQIREGMKPIFDQFNMNIEVDLKEVKVHGDYGLTRCTYFLHITPKTGGETIPAEPDGKALTIYGRQPDGSWKVLYDCFNSNVSPT